MLSPLQRSKKACRLASILRLGLALAREFALGLDPSFIGGNHSLALPALMSSFNLPLRRISISQTKTRRKSLFSRGSRERVMLLTVSLDASGSSNSGFAVCLLLGVPSGRNHIGGDEAFAVRTDGGRHVASATTGGSSSTEGGEGAR